MGIALVFWYLSHFLYPSWLPDPEFLGSNDTRSQIRWSLQLLTAGTFHDSVIPWFYFNSHPSRELIPSAPKSSFSFFFLSPCLWFSVHIPFLHWIRVNLFTYYFLPTLLYLRDYLPNANWCFESTNVEMNLSKSKEGTKVNPPMSGIFGRAKLSIRYLFSLSHEPAVWQTQKGREGPTPSLKALQSSRERRYIFSTCHTKRSNYNSFNVNIAWIWVENAQKCAQSQSFEKCGRSILTFFLIEWLAFMDTLMGERAAVLSNFSAPYKEKEIDITGGEEAIRSRNHLSL